MTYVVFILKNVAKAMIAVQNLLRLQNRVIGLQMLPALI